MNPSFLAPVVGNSVPELGATFAQSNPSNVYLTSGSFGLQNISMTAFGQSVFLPPAYSIVPGQGKFTIRNNGQYSFGVRDSTGTLLTAVAANGVATFSLDNGTNWVFYGQGLEPGLITMAGTFSSTFTTSSLRVQYVALDNNTSIHFALLTANGFAAFIVDNLGKVLTTPVTVSAAASSIPVSAFRIDANNALLLYGEGATTNRAVVLTVSGISPNLVLTVNTPALFATSMSSLWGSENGVDNPTVAQLNANNYLATYGPVGANLGSVVINVTGTTVIFGTGTNVAITSGLIQGSQVAFPLTATTVLIIFIDVNGGNNIVRAVVATVTGLAVAYGAVVSNTGPVITTSPTFSACQLSSTKTIVGMVDNTNVSRFQAITVTGTVVAFGATSTPVAAAGSGQQLNFSTRGSNRFNPHIVRLGTNTAVVDYDISPSASWIYTESAGTLTATSIYFGLTSTGGTGAVGYGATFSMGTTEYLSVRQVNATVPFSLRVQQIKISGTSLVPDGSVILPNVISNIEAPLSATVRLQNGNYALIPSTDGITAIPVIRVSSGDGVIYRGNVTGFPWMFAVNNAQNAQIPNRIIVLGSSTPQGNSTAAGTPSLVFFNLEIAA